LAGDPFDFLSNVPALLSSLPSCSLLRQLYRYLIWSKMTRKRRLEVFLLAYPLCTFTVVDLHFKVWMLLVFIFTP
jgi:hypothetical protein